MKQRTVWDLVPSIQFSYQPAPAPRRGMSLLEYCIVRAYLQIRLADVETEALKIIGPCGERYARREWEGLRG